MANLTKEETKNLSLIELEKLAREEGNIDYLISYVMDMCLTYGEQRSALYYALYGEEI